ncbi:MAG TPA: hypothetical protein VMW52_09700 [Phycisphaerae bacterium]|nr:hypothetical protein [Phycisphaerae bacterium]
MTIVANAADKGKPKSNPPEPIIRARWAMLARINANAARLPTDDLARVDIAVAKLAKGARL